MKIFFRSLAIFILMAGDFLFLGQFTNAETANHLVISEVQITGGSGQAMNEFVEIYNPTESSINLNLLPLKLHIRNSSGTDQNKSLTFITEIIPAHGYFLIGPPSGYTGAITLDATYSTSGNTLVANARFKS